MGVAVRRLIVSRDGKRPPDVYGLAVSVTAKGPADMLKSWRQYSDDAELATGKANRPVQNGKIGMESSAPQSIAEDDDRVALLEFLRSQKLATERRLTSED